ncbi:MAG: hypothetical protein VCE74_19155 [Alphaproteobacteria bacterium]|jgi:hypothetical protein
MLKVLIFALAGVFISGTALAGGGLGYGSCSGGAKAETTATSTPVGTPSATTAQTPIPKTTKPESKS